MAAEKKDCGFVLVRAKLGATQTHDAQADRRVNINDRDAEYSCSTTDGTSVAVIETVLAKMQAAIANQDARVKLLVDGKQIVG